MLNRRVFLKTVGGGAFASALVGASAAEPQPTAMTYRTHPKSGDKVSILGYGCMRWPTRPLPNGEGTEIDQETVNELVDTALAHGVNYFDTAPVYCQGRSENATGIALSRHPRDAYYLATKMSNFAPERRSFAASKALYENSMRALRTDYIDYYLLHSIGDMASHRSRFLDNGVLDFLIKEREAGRIRHLGWSFHGEKQFFDYMMTCGVPWDFVQIQLNYIDWRHASGRNVDAEYLYGELEKRNIPAVIMEPLLGGRLARLNHRSLETLKALEPENSAASWAFRFAGTPPKVLTVLSGMAFREHLEDNLRTYSPLKPVDEREKATLEDVARQMLSFPFVRCTACQYCMPCPYGIDIPAIFNHYNRCLAEGDYADTPQDADYQKARRAFLIGYDRAVPKLRQAERCTGCSQCKPLCPQKIDISKEMRRIDAYVERLRKNA